MRQLVPWAIFAAVFFLWPEETDAAGTLGWIAILLGATLLVTPIAVCFAIVRSLPEKVVVSECPETEVPPEVRHLAEAFAAQGFRRHGHALRFHLPSEAVLVPLVHEEDNLMATAYAIDSTPRRVACDVVSVLDAPEAGLTTASDRGAGVLPAATGSLRQIFPGADVPELVMSHRDALRWLEVNRVPTIAVAPAAIPALIKDSFRLNRKTFLQSPVGNTFRALVRTVTRRNPHMGPLQQQRGVEAQVELLRRRRTPARLLPPPTRKGM